MKFGEIPVPAAEGAILAHAVKQNGVVFKKGIRLTDADIAALVAAGVERVMVAQLEPGDASEDEAAHALALKLAGDGVSVEGAFTGRSNLFAASDGLLVIDKQGVDDLNAVDEAITFATLDNFKPVVAGEMVATVKIIPFAVPDSMLNAGLASIRRPVLCIAPYTVKTVAVVSTVLPGLKPSIVDKTVKVMGERLAASGSKIIADERVPHEASALTQALQRVAPVADLTVVFGASAITDRHDVIPSAIVAGGGSVEHFGMPVDPGNLLLIGSLVGKPVIGAPGCARSPRINGFDWVLQRLLAGLPVKRADIEKLGVGGLLMEIVSRPQPREANVHVGTQQGSVLPAKIANVVLAAGRSTRMGSNKLLADVFGKPLVRHSVESALQAGIGDVLVVTGHQHIDVERALDGLPVTFVHNPAYADGLSTSLKAGLVALPKNVDGVVVMLGDMPRVQPNVVQRLAGAFQQQRDALAIVPTVLGERGNPVLLSRGLFAASERLHGDIGARKLLEAAGDRVVEIQVDDPNIHNDVDTPEALQSLRDQKPT